MPFPRTYAAINILCKRGGGSQGIDLVQQMPDEVYEATKRSAIRYLKANLAALGGIDILEKFPFSLWQATNDFGDDFEVLYLKAGMELYVEIENGVGLWKTQISGIPEIARAFEAVGHPLRFIAVGLDLEEKIDAVAPPTLTITSAIVEEALRQAETLIGKHGAASGLDRVHTAFHGYLAFVCQKAGITVKPEAGITDLFARLRGSNTPPLPSLTLKNGRRAMTRSLTSTRLVVWSTVCGRSA